MPNVYFFIFKKVCSLVRSVFTRQKENKISALDHVSLEDVISNSRLLDFIRINDEVLYSNNCRKWAEEVE